jgi:hypothetical protein
VHSTRATSSHQGRKLAETWRNGRKQASNQDMHTEVLRSIVNTDWGGQSVYRGTANLASRVGVASRQNTKYIKINLLVRYTSSHVYSWKGCGSAYITCTPVFRAVHLAQLVVGCDIFTDAVSVWTLSGAKSKQLLYM